MRKFSEQYARSSGTKFCMDKSVTAVVIQGTFLITQPSLSFGLFCGPIAFSSLFEVYLHQQEEDEEKNSFVFLDGGRVLSRMK